MHAGRTVVDQDPALDPRLDLAVRLARDVADLTQSFYREQNLAVHTKRDGSPVTIADREAELLISRHIEHAFPDDAMLGEEHGERPGRSGFRWIVDPIDGTASFIRAVPLYGTLIGVEYQGEPVLGVISMPALGEMIYARAGGGAHHELLTNPASRRRIRVSAASTPADALLTYTDPAIFNDHSTASALRRLERAFARCRGWGDCYAFFLVATGRADAAVEPPGFMKIWDLCALPTIIREAGGVFTDWMGRPTIHGPGAVATNGIVHRETLRLIAGQ